MANKIVNSMPVKMWIDGKIFSIQKLNKNCKTSKKEQEESTSEADQQSEHLKLLEITQDDGKFITNIKVPMLYCLKMRNLPGFDIAKVSEETSTKILVPKLGGGDDKITIHSDCTNKLLKAVTHIHAAIGEIRERNIALQFTCIPCSNSNIREKFENLKTEILQLHQEIEGLHESIFISPLKLHVTIDVHVLLDENEKAEAIKALNEYKAPLEQLLLKNGPLKLDIGTLDCMKNNIKKVDVLYANVKLLDETEEHNLQKIANDISNHFYHKGFAKKYQENVKLHMTIINTKYRKMLDSPRRKRRKQSIDATKIMEKFKDYKFGICDLESVHLSHMSLKGEDGFYKPLAVIKLDPNKELVT